MSDDDPHAFNGMTRRSVDADDACMRTIRKPRIDVQLIGEFQPVVDVNGLAGHMFVGAVMFDAAPCAGGDSLLKEIGHFGLSLLRGVIRHSESPALVYEASATR